jgi:hypothetical protein
MSELQTQIARRAAALSTLAIIQETKLAAGEDIDIGQFVLLTNALNRTSERLGLARVPVDVTSEISTDLESGKGDCQLSLRRAQLETALGGNATMQIWLGKQLLGQKDSRTRQRSSGRYKKSMHL